MELLELLEQEFTPEVRDVTPEENIFLLDNEVYRCAPGTF